MNTGAPPSLKLEYLKWNDLLAKHFFNPTRAQRPVYLDVTTELIDSIGDPFGASCTDFVHALKVGPPWASSRNVCRLARDTYTRWRRRDLDYPPYVAYLCLFALAAGLDGDFHANAYYPRLRTLLGEDPVSGTYSYFHDVVDIWDDLETWSVEDKDGDLGIFEVRIAGSKFYVGIPIAQVVLSEHERDILPALFSSQGVDPRALPVDQELLRILRAHGTSLSRRTHRLLERPNLDSTMADAILSVVRRTLENWDGNLPANSEPGSSRTSRRSENGIYGVLFLALRIDSVTGRAQTTLRCRLHQELPEDGVRIQGHGVPDLLLSQESANWSHPLRTDSFGPPFDASSVDWSSGLTLQGGDGKVTLRPASVRIFESGEPKGLPGLIEAASVQLGREYYVAVRQELSSALVDWGRTNSKNDVREIPVVAGLPSGWLLFKAGPVLGGDSPDRGLEPLAITETTRLTFTGGIRLGRSNSYFHFAPPEIELESDQESVRVICNGEHIEPDDVTGRFILPSDLPLGQRLLVVARDGDRELDRLRITLEATSSWQSTDFDSQQPIERSGLEIRRYQGHSVRFALLPAGWHFQDPVGIYLIGAGAGQVCDWEHRLDRGSWDPVWAVKIGRHGILLTVHFCGRTLTIPGSSLVDSEDASRIHLWKSILAHPAHRVRLPSHGAVIALWSSYRDAANRL